MTLDLIIIGILTSGIRLATPYLYAAIGETFGQRQANPTDHFTHYYLISPCRSILSGGKGFFLVVDGKGEEIYSLFG